MLRRSRQVRMMEESTYIASNLHKTRHQSSTEWIILSQAWSFHISLTQDKSLPTASANGADNFFSELRKFA